MKACKPARMAGAIAVVCAATLTLAPAAGAATGHRHAVRQHRSVHAGHGVTVTVKVLGRAPAYRKLLSRTVTLTGVPVARDGGSCTGMSGAGALQIATKGHWAGTWDSEFSDYEVTGIESLNLPFKAKAAADWYWKLMVNGREASAGICAVHPRSGQTLLFKPACYGKACPKAKAARNAGAGPAERRRPHRRRHGRA